MCFYRVAARGMAAAPLLFSLTVLSAGDAVVRPGAPPALEELAATEVVTSVSRKQQRLRDSPAAVFVITSEDIRRSGARNIPEVLRMVPGLHVARLDSSTWAISSRGFNGRFANKMLVLVDGRSVYNTIFSGVYWDLQDTLLEDIERIEVIRGPGATMWGANAVNGVISIITKNSRDTQGSYAGATYGTEGQKSTHLRHGGAIGKSGHYRVFGKYDAYEALSGPNDSWGTRRGGIRADFTRGVDESFEIQTNFVELGANGNLVGQSYTPPYQRTISQRTTGSGVSVQGKWQRGDGSSDDTSIQFYADRSSRQETLGSGWAEQYNIEAQRRRRYGLHEVTGGAGYRRLREDLSEGSMAEFRPRHFGYNLFSGFVQDQIGTEEDRFNLIAGAKVEHNAFTGVEIQPRLQATVQHGKRQMSWFSAARAVRTPSRYENNVEMDTSVLPGPGVPIQIRVLGSPLVRAEELLATEAGYRHQPVNQVTLDFAAFYNVYRHIASAEPQIPRMALRGVSPVVLQELRISNLLEGTAMGLEGVFRYEPLPAWRISAGLSHLQVNVRPTEESRDSFMSSILGRGPRHKAEVRSLIDLPHFLELDTLAYYVSSVRGTDIPGYTRVDLRLGVRRGSHLELSVHAENLLDNAHIEFHPEIYGSGSVIGRSIRSTITWRF